MDIQLIDFGSSYKFDDGPTDTFPSYEYMPPEMLQYFSSAQKNVDVLEDTTNFSTDVWSLGITLIEIISGLPIGIQTKCQIIPLSKKQKTTTGVLCVKDNNPKRLLKQIS